LCYNLTKSTPGFTLDAHDCNSFYKCEPNGEGGWNTFHKKCPACTFWNQDLLTCVQVYDGPECITTGHMTDPVNYTTPIEERLMFCINFEDDDLVAKGPAFVYEPWIRNDGVTIVDNTVNPGVNCPEGQRCGFFNESVLQIPFFSNNYAQWPSLRITLSYRMTSFGLDLDMRRLDRIPDKGIISNDCFPEGNGLYASGNSLYCSADDIRFKAGLNGPSPDNAVADGSAVSAN
ncbi:hypothetical protein LSAT2_031859, partial [Lamellibrachia satsuma]